MSYDELEGFSGSAKEIAFYLQDNIYRHGLPPIHFIEAGADRARVRAKSTIKKNLRTWLK